MDGLRRIKAVFTPQVIALLGLALALFGFSCFTTQEKNQSLEVRASKVLSQVEGAGKVEVAIMSGKAMQRIQGCFQEKAEGKQRFRVVQLQWRRERTIRLSVCSLNRPFALCLGFQFQR